MTADPVTVQGTISIHEAAKVMTDFDVGLLLVYSDKSLIGVVTDRDIVRRAIAVGFSCDHPISTIISTEIISVHEGDSLVSAAAIMRKRQVRRLIVLDTRDEAVGVITRTEVLNSVLPAMAECIAAIT